MFGPSATMPARAAFRQVMNYFRQNQEEMRRVIQTEVDVSIEKDGYILAGKVDLLLGSDGKLELLDFKTSERSTDPRCLKLTKISSVPTRTFWSAGMASAQTDYCSTGQRKSRRTSRDGISLPTGAGREAGRHFERGRADPGGGIPGGSPPRAGNLQGMRPTDALHAARRT